MKKILIVTYYWPPSGGAGVQRILKFAKYLPQFGILPFVVTPDEKKASYPVLDHTLVPDVPKDVSVARTDTSEPFEIYSKILGRKSIPTGFSNESKPGMLQKFSRFVRGNFFIPDARRGWVKFAFEESKKIIRREGIDTMLITSPPHSAQVVGLKLKKEFPGIRWIADFRDPWTDIYYYNEFHHLPYARNLDRKLEKEVIEKSDRIITVGGQLRKILSSKSPAIAQNKIEVIPNGFDEEDFADFDKIKNDRQEKFVITYTGTIADSYNPAVFFKSLKDASSDFSGGDFIMRFVGNPATTVIENFKSLIPSGHLEIIPTVTHDMSLKYLSESSALLLVIPEIANDKSILTGKLFEYLASRKKIICIGPADGDAAEIIRECKAGKTFDRSMGAALTDYIAELFAEWKSKGNCDTDSREYLKYSRRNETERLSEIIKTI